uniref:Uncharacterized protein n=1 Tax=Anopheles arabiensis TaxID=7173 RepID=A0A182IHQ1_ANOAR
MLWLTSHIEINQ